MANATYVPSRSEAIKKYKEWLPEQLSLKSPQRQEFIRLLRHVTLFGNLVLLCHCNPLECHGDFIKELMEQALSRRKT